MASDENIGEGMKSVNYPLNKLFNDIKTFL